MSISVWDHKTGDFKANGIQSSFINGYTKGQCSLELIERHGN